MTESPTTRLSLLMRLRDPDDGLAWEQFVSLYTPLVYGFARRKGLQDADAADIAQDVMTSVAQQMRQWTYDPTRGSFRGWLFTIARNRLKNWLASPARNQNGRGGSEPHQALETKPDHDQDQVDWDEEFARRVFHWAAEEVQRQVSEQTWQAFESTAIRGQSGPEVAEQLGMSAGAVYLARSRVMARLRDLVQSVRNE